MSAKVKFAVVGVGHIGMRHAEMISRNPNAELVALCDIKNIDLPDSDWSTIPFFSHFDALIASKLDFDVINICVPNGLHADFSLKALARHKNIVVEKPLALSRIECEKIIFKSLEVSKHVFCVMQNRYSPPSVWLKELIKNNVLGDVYMVQLNCFWNRDERYYKKGNWHGTADLDGGTLFTQFSHFVDVMYWLFGDIQNIKGNFKDFAHKELTDFEDSGMVTFDFVEGGMGSLNYSTAVYNKNMESSITIVAKNGTVKVAGQYMNEVVYCDIKDYEMPVLAPSNPPNDYGTYKGSAQNHHYVIQNVVDKMMQKESISTNALEGMKVVDIIERMYACRDAEKK